MFEVESEDYESLFGFKLELGMVFGGDDYLLLFLLILYRESDLLVSTSELSDSLDGIESSLDELLFSEDVLRWRIR